MTAAEQDRRDNVFTYDRILNSLPLFREIHIRFLFPTAD
jgi:hypothetical protein